VTDDQDFEGQYGTWAGESRVWADPNRLHYHSRHAVREDHAPPARDVDSGPGTEDPPKEPEEPVGSRPTIADWLGEGDGWIPIVGFSAVVVSFAWAYVNQFGPPDWVLQLLR
jgi:hypothetical protein